MNTSTSKDTTSDITRDPRWSWLLSRDPSLDGKFFYSVRTTGVYCYPSCGARRPKPENVQFHATMTEAENAGFRPCKRCNPRQLPMLQQHALKVAEACRSMEAAEEEPALGRLAAQAGMSPYHFHRIFRSVTGITPKKFAAASRAERMRQQLSSAAGTVTDAIYTAGYNSDSRFYETSKQTLGMRPKKFQAGGRDTTILFSTGECSLGMVLVARSERGICAILLGEDSAKLQHDLQQRFSRADIRAAGSDFDDLVAKVVKFVECPGKGLGLPLDIRGTLFQQRVWQALCEIPAGATASYSAIAQRIGSPGSVRAVAQACAANALAVAVPCHRIVRNDGGLSGYRWGIERKRELLTRESKGSGNKG